MILLGNRVLVQLQEAPPDSVTEKGIHKPALSSHISDSGRTKTEKMVLKYLPVGKVLAISTEAAQLLEKQGNKLSVGDTIFVPYSAVSANFSFFMDRTVVNQDFTGLISIPHTLCEAIID